MNVRQTIVSTFQDVAKEHHKTLGPLEDDAPLLELGLDSLCLAVIVARLERELGRDPFSADEEVDMPVTFGDLVALYETALA